MAVFVIVATTLLSTSLIKDNKVKFKEFLLSEKSSTKTVRSVKLKKNPTNPNTLANKGVEAVPSTTSVEDIKPATKSEIDAVPPSVQKAFLKKYEEISIREMDRTGIPASTRLFDWTGKIYGVYKGYITDFTKDSSRFWTYYNTFGQENDCTRLIDRAGKTYGTINGEVRGFTNDKNQFYIEKEDCTYFYNLDCTLVAVYQGKVEFFTADGKQVLLRVSMGTNDVWQYHDLYDSVHDFMKRKIAPLTLEERAKYEIPEGY